MYACAHCTELLREKEAKEGKKKPTQEKQQNEEEEKQKAAQNTAKQVCVWCLCVHIMLFVVNMHELLLSLLCLRGREVARSHVFKQPFSHNPF